MQPNRVPFLLAVVVALTFAVSGPASAQIMYPFPAYRYAAPDASVRIEATPKEAEVYVDGYYAGTVDDFDGVFQRLHVEPGQHEIVLYREGFRSVHQQVYLMADKTFHIRATMEPLAAGDAAEARPVPAPQPQVETQAPPFGAPGPQFPRGPQGGRRVPPRTLPPPNGPGPDGPPRGPGDQPPTSQTGIGSLTIQLQPADADILIDGQPFASNQRQGNIVIDLSEGRHVVQVRRQGYVGYLTEVEVRRGEMTTVNVMLRTQP